MLKSLIRMLCLFSMCTLVSWHFTNDHQKAHFLPWVSTTLDMLWPGELPEYFKLPTRITYVPDGNPDTANNAPLLTTTLEGELQQTTAGTLKSICRPKNTKTVSVKTEKVYSWVDSNGHLQFSDSAPPETSQARNSLKTRSFKTEQLFKINLDTTHAKLPPFAQDRFRSELNQIYRFLKTEIKARHLTQTNLDIKVFDNRSAYNAYQQRFAPTLGRTSGFYSPKENITAIYAGQYNQATFSITRHEAVHAILSNLFGYVPIWFNEGLAEVFGALELKSQSRTLPIINHHIKTLQKAQQQKTLPKLSTFMNIHHSDWYKNKTQHLHYAVSWSLVHWLLTHSEGEVLINQLVNHWGEQYCKPFSSIQYLQQNYPGGITTLEEKWLHWIQSPSKKSFYF